MDIYWGRYCSSHYFYNQVLVNVAASEGTHVSRNAAVQVRRRPNEVCVVIYHENHCDVDELVLMAVSWNGVQYSYDASWSWNYQVFSGNRNLILYWNKQDIRCSWLSLYMCLFPPMYQCYVTIVFYFLPFFISIFLSFFFQFSFSPYELYM